MNVEFDTADYEDAHGKPKGRGTWIVEVPLDDGTTERWVADDMSTFTEVKTQVRGFVKRLTITRRISGVCSNITVRVLP